MDEKTRNRYLADIEYFSEQFEADPSSKVFFPLAVAYCKLEKFDEVISVCRQGLATYPDYFSAKVVLGEALYRTGNLDEARDVLTEVITYNDDNYRAHKLLGHIHLNLEDTDTAVAYFRTALQKAPEDDELRAKLEELSADVAEVVKEDVKDLRDQLFDGKEEEQSFFNIENDVQQAQKMMNEIINEAVFITQGDLSKQQGLDEYLDDDGDELELMADAISGVASDTLADTDAPVEVTDDEIQAAVRRHEMKQEGYTDEQIEEMEALARSESGTLQETIEEKAPSFEITDDDILAAIAEHEKETGTTVDFGKAEKDADAEAEALAAQLVMDDDPVAAAMAEMQAEADEEDPVAAAMREMQAEADDDDDPVAAAMREMQAEVEAAEQEIAPKPKAAPMREAEETLNGAPSLADAFAFAADMTADELMAEINDNDVDALNAALGALGGMPGDASAERVDDMPDALPDEAAELLDDVVSDEMLAGMMEDAPEMGADEPSEMLTDDMPEDMPEELGETAEADELLPEDESLIPDELLEGFAGEAGLTEDVGGDELPADGAELLTEDAELPEGEAALAETAPEELPDELLDTDAVFDENEEVAGESADASDLAVDFDPFADDDTFVDDFEDDEDLDSFDDLEELEGDEMTLQNAESVEDLKKTEEEEPEEAAAEGEELPEGELVEGEEAELSEDGEMVAEGEEAAEEGAEPAAEKPETVLLDEDFLGEESYGASDDDMTIAENIGETATFHQPEIIDEIYQASGIGDDDEDDSEPVSEIDLLEEMGGMPEGEVPDYLLDEDGNPVVSESAEEEPAPKRMAVDTAELTPDELVEGDVDALVGDFAEASADAIEMLDEFSEVIDEAVEALEADAGEELDDDVVGEFVPPQPPDELPEDIQALLDAENVAELSEEPVDESADEPTDEQAETGESVEVPQAVVKAQINRLEKGLQIFAKK